MDKIGLFYGSDTGCTEAMVEIIKEFYPKNKLDIYDVYDVKKEDFFKYNKIIIGLSTWHDGQLVSAWDDFFEEFKKIDLTGKIVAIFGLGDQFGYSSYFIDGVGIIGKEVEKNGGKLVGCWPTKDYEHDESKAEMGNGYFMGLALDEDNQDDLSEDRMKKWIEQIKIEGIN